MTSETPNPSLSSLRRTSPYGKRKKREATMELKTFEPDSL
jgi:hypothetical protein